MRKFSLEEKMEIQKKYEDGATQTELALEYNCSVADIRRVIKEGNFHNGIKISSKSEKKNGEFIFLNPINKGDE